MMVAFQTAFGCGHEFSVTQHIHTSVHEYKSIRKRRLLVHRVITVKIDFQQDGDVRSDRNPLTGP